MTAGNALRSRPFPFLLALSGLLALFAGVPAQADPGWHGEGRGRGEWHHGGWHPGWRRGWDRRPWGGPGYAAPGYAYAPPVVAYAPAPVYAPPPVFYMPPSLNIVVPLHFP